MIEFTCGECGRAYSVPDAAAGKKAKCKCGAALVVPAGHTAAAPISPAPPPVVPSVSENPPITSGSGATLPPSAADQPKPSGSLGSRSREAAEKRVAPPPATPPAAPSFAPPAAAPPPAGKLPMRTRRLIADAAEMAKAFADFPMIKLKATTGAPPEVYQIEYAIRGLDRGKKREPIPRDHHVVEIQLTSDYPRIGPKCRMLTPIFHPNIDPATICVGDHWTAGERLAQLVVRIGEMIAYQAYNIKSPLDAEAAMWADLNREKLPVDTRNLHPAQLGD